MLIYNGYFLLPSSGTSTANLGTLIFIVGLGLGVALLAISSSYLKVARQYQFARHELEVPDTIPLIVATVLGCFLFAPIAIPAGVYALYVRSKLIVYWDRSGKE